MVLIKSKKKMRKQENPNKIEKVSKIERTRISNENEEINPANEAIETLDFIEGTVEKSIEVAGNTVETIEESSLSPENKKLFIGRLKIHLKYMFKVMAFTTMSICAMEAALETVGYKRTRYKVESHSKNGEMVYSHEDPQTTHYINLLAGKEKLNDSDRKEILINSLKNKNEPLKIAELENSTKTKLNYNILESGGFDPELYAALWKLEQEYGNPKIKLISGRDFDVDTRAYYNNRNNIMYLNIDSMDTIENQYIAELSHAKQYDRNPVHFMLREYYAVLKTEVRHLSSKKPGSHQSKYDLLYNEPGSIEYEAHRIIEPKLKSELETLTPIRIAAGIAQKKEKEQAHKKAYERIQELREEEEKNHHNLHNSALRELREFEHANPHLEMSSAQYKEKMDQIARRYFRKVARSSQDFGKKMDDIYNSYEYRDWRD